MNWLSKYFLNITQVRINLSVTTFFCLVSSFFDFANAKDYHYGDKRQISEILVTADYEGNFDIDGYRANFSRSSTKTETRLINIPQSIAIVTQDQIRDQNISNMEGALRYVAGVNIQQGEGHRDQITIRGNSTNSDFFVDGARDDLQYLRDFYNIEKIEFLKGSNALAFGRGGSGGVVNRLTKVADGKKRKNLTISGGSFDNRRAEFDLSDKFDDKMAIRLNSFYEKSNSYRKYVNFERYGFSPTISIFNEDTDLKLGYENFSDNRLTDRGIPSSNGYAYKTKYSTFFGNPEQNNADAQINSIYADLNHEFDSSLKLRNFTKYGVNSKYYQNVYVSASSSQVLTLKAYSDETQRNNFTNQTDLTKKFLTGSLQHQLLIGSELTNQRTENLRKNGYFNDSTSSINVAIDDPLDFTSVTYRAESGANNTISDVWVYAAYAQDQIEISKYLQLIAGLRFDRFGVNIDDNNSGSRYSRIDSMISPRFGLVLKPQENLSFYGGYSVSYLPSSGEQFVSLDSKTSLLKPEKLENYEIGAKWDISPKMNGSAALFVLDRTNSKILDPSGSGFYLTNGESRTKGLEVSLSGKINTAWQIISGYTLQNASILKDTSVATKGKKIAMTPRQRISIWNKYDFSKKWAAALGFINQSDQFAGADNSVRLKGFNRFDAAVYYKINNSYRLQANLENLLNRGYIQSAHNNNNLSPGSPRAFKISLISEF